MVALSVVASAALFLLLLAGAVAGRGTDDATLAGPGSAGAPRPAAEKVARLTLRGSNGYKVGLLAPIEGAGSPIGVSVEDRRGEVEYMARGLASAHRLKASFGRLGEVDLVFHPSGRVLRSPSSLVGGCPAGASAQPGTFTGSFRLRGDGGFTVAGAHKVHGTVGAPTAPTDRREEKAQLVGCVTREPLWKSSGATAVSGGQGGSPSLGAESIMPGRSVLIAAAPLQISGDPRAEGGEATIVVDVLVREELEGVTVSRVALGGGPQEQVLAIAADDSEAVLTPGPPFSGSATFAKGPERSVTWSGDLSVPLPGLGPVALAGPGFTARLGG